MVAGTRREARERAVELLYEADTKDLDPRDVMAALPLPTDDYARELASGVADHRIEIDAVLDRFSERWPVSRMATMDRTVLRVGVLELAVHHEVPTGVSLSEAVELGAQYGSTDDTSKFVNGILARVAEEVRGDDGTRPWLPIEVVVFDMDGVIRHWVGDDIAEFEQARGLPAGAVAAVAFADPIYPDVTVGRITVEEWAEAVGEGLAAAHDGVVAADGTAMWLATNWRVDDRVVELVRSLRAAGQATAVFSNATSRLEKDMDTMAVTDLFDHIANSSRLGMAKPEVAAFRAVADSLAVPPERLLFIDDRADNVEGAVDAGWHAVQMRGVEALGDVLRRLGVAGAPDAT